MRRVRFIILPAQQNPPLEATLTLVNHSFGGDPAYYMRPVLYFNEEERLIIQYFRRLFTGFGDLPRPSTIPPISEAQAEALDALQFLSEENSLKLTFQKGDIQYINNLSIFHARDSFKDSPEKKLLSPYSPSFSPFLFVCTKLLI